MARRHFLVSYAALDSYAPILVKWPPATLLGMGIDGSNLAPYFSHSLSTLNASHSCYQLGYGVRFSDYKSLIFEE